MTLLATEVSEDKRTASLLRTSSRRGPLTLSGRSPQSIFCCKALSGVIENLPGCITVNVVPGKHVPILSDHALRQMAEALQPKLLHYRLQALRAAVASTPYLSGASSVDDPPPLAAAIVEDDELQQEIIASLGDRPEEHTDPRSIMRAIVVECCLAVTHENKSEIKVGELAKLANAALVGRGEKLELSDRKVGALLKGMGLLTAPIQDKRGLELLEPIRRRIHELALEYKVPTIWDRKVLCELCEECWGERLDFMERSGSAGEPHQAGGASG